jgi:4-amino-4-deoxy-L-arabinose transferase-like glycosyltransferase
LAAVRLTWEAITGRGIHALAGDAYPLLKSVPQLAWVFNLIGWLVVAAALWLAWRLVRDWRSQDTESRQAAQVDFVLLSWLLVPVLFNLRHSLDLHLHFFALVLPAAYLLVGRAAQGLRSYPLAPWFRAAGVVSIGLLAAAQVLALVLMARFVARQETPGGFGVSLGRYQAVVDGAVAAARETRASEVLVVGRGDSVVVDDLPAIFDVLLRGRTAYRFVDGDAAAVFPPHAAVALISPEAGEASSLYSDFPVRELPDGYRLAILDGTWPQAGFAPAAGPGVFQNGVAVQGYSGTASLEATEAARLWLLWQVLWLDAADTHFSARLVDEDGQVRGQQDAVGYPTAYRQKGDRIISKFDIKTLLSSGEFESVRAQVGMYTFPDIVSVPVVDQAGNPVDHVVVLGTLDGQQ